MLLCLNLTLSEEPTYNNRQAVWYYPKSTHRCEVITMGHVHRKYDYGTFISQ